MAIGLPRLVRLEISEYGLYPGNDKSPGLTITFRDGLTLVLGANGLGKTTLVAILFRMLSGPFDLPGLVGGGDVGGGRIDSKPMPVLERGLFAARVRDAASNATATLDFALGSRNVCITRRLKDLAIVSLEVDGEELDASSEAYEQAILDAANVGSFGDWLLILRLLVFYFEDRRALIWDQSAQGQLLRLLFLPPSQASEWTAQEREIRSLDSLIRNLQYSFNKEERSYVRAQRAATGADEVKQQIELLQAVQSDERARLDDLEEHLPDALNHRQEARLAALTAEQAVDSTLRNLERMQLAAVDTAFPSADVTARYLLGHILADRECLTCGNDVPHFAEELRQRILDDRCPVCASAVARRPGRRFAREITATAKQAEAAESQLKAATTAKEEAERAYDALLSDISTLTASTARRSAEINDLVRRLPPDEQDLHKQRSAVGTLLSRLEQHRQRISTMRADFETFVNRVNKTIATQKDDIKEAFDEFASGFLVEKADLIWSPQKRRVGESGQTIEFPSFELDMTGGNFVSAVRRSGPEQVSESQREFIDLAFRMALMAVASQGSGTLVIDAPESSLDAVFVKRAADVLSKFGKQRENRLVITSNLIDGNLIPELLYNAGVRTPRDPRVLDLLRVAAPTAATTRLKSEYQTVRRDIFKRTAELYD